MRASTPAAAALRLLARRLSFQLGITHQPLVQPAVGDGGGLRRCTSSTHHRPGAQGQEQPPNGGADICASDALLARICAAPDLATLQSLAQRQRALRRHGQAGLAAAHVTAILQRAASLCAPLSPPSPPGAAGAPQRPQHLPRHASRAARLLVERLDSAWGQAPAAGQGAAQRVLPHLHQGRTSDPLGLNPAQPQQPATAEGAGQGSAVSRWSEGLGSVEQRPLNINGIPQALARLTALARLQAPGSRLMQAAVAELSGSSVGGLAKSIAPADLADAASAIAALGRHNPAAPLVDKLALALAEQAGRAADAPGGTAPLPAHLVQATVACAHLRTPCALLMQVIARLMRDMPGAFSVDDAEAVLWAAAQGRYRSPRLLQAAAATVMHAARSQRLPDSAILRLLNLYGRLDAAPAALLRHLCDRVAAGTPTGADANAAALIACARVGLHHQGLLAQAESALLSGLASAPQGATGLPVQLPSRKVADAAVACQALAVCSTRLADALASSLDGTALSRLMRKRGAQEMARLASALVDVGGGAGSPCLQALAETLASIGVSRVAPQQAHLPSNDQLADGSSPQPAATRSPRQDDSVTQVSLLLRAVSILHAGNQPGRHGGDATAAPGPAVSRLAAAVAATVCASQARLKLVDAGQLLQACAALPGVAAAHSQLIQRCLDDAQHQVQALATGARGGTVHDALKRPPPLPVAAPPGGNEQPIETGLGPSPSVAPPAEPLLTPQLQTPAPLMSVPHTAPATHALQGVTHLLLGLARLDPAARPAALVSDAAGMLAGLLRQQASSEAEEEAQLVLLAGGDHGYSRAILTARRSGPQGGIAGSHSSRNGVDSSRAVSWQVRSPWAALIAGALADAILPGGQPCPAATDAAAALLDWLGKERPQFSLSMLSAAQRGGIGAACVRLGVTSHPTLGRLRENQAAGASMKARDVRIRESRGFERPQGEPPEGLQPSATPDEHWTPGAAMPLQPAMIASYQRTAQGRDALGEPEAKGAVHSSDGSVSRAPGDPQPFADAVQAISALAAQGRRTALVQALQSHAAAALLPALTHGEAPAALVRELVQALSDARAGGRHTPLLVAIAGWLKARREEPGITVLSQLVAHLARLRLAALSAAQPAAARYMPLLDADPVERALADVYLPIAAGLLGYSTDTPPASRPAAAAVADRMPIMLQCDGVGGAMALQSEAEDPALGVSLSTAQAAHLHSALSALHALGMLRRLRPGTAGPSAGLLTRLEMRSALISRRAVKGGPGAAQLLRCATATLLQASCQKLQWQLARPASVRSGPSGLQGVAPAQQGQEAGSCAQALSAACHWLGQPKAMADGALRAAQCSVLSAAVDALTAGGTAVADAPAQLDTGLHALTAARAALAASVARDGSEAAVGHATPATRAMLRAAALLGDAAALPADLRQMRTPALLELAHATAPVDSQQDTVSAAVVSEACRRAAQPEATPQRALPPPVCDLLALAGALALGGRANDAVLHAAALLLDPAAGLPPPAPDCHHPTHPDWPALHAAACAHAACGDVVRQGHLRAWAANIHRVLHGRLPAPPSPHAPAALTPVPGAKASADGGSVVEPAAVKDLQPGKPPTVTKATAAGLAGLLRDRGPLMGMDGWLDLRLPASLPDAQQHMRVADVLRVWRALAAVGWAEPRSAATTAEHVTGRLAGARAVELELGDGVAALQMVAALAARTAAGVRSDETSEDALPALLRLARVLASDSAKNAWLLPAWQLRGAQAAVADLLAARGAEDVPLPEPRSPSKAALPASPPPRYCTLPQARAVLRAVEGCGGGAAFGWIGMSSHATPAGAGVPSIPRQQAATAASHERADQQHLVPSAPASCLSFLATLEEPTLPTAHAAALLLAATAAGDEAVFMEALVRRMIGAGAEDRTTAMPTQPSSPHVPRALISAWKAQRADFQTAAYMTWAIAARHSNGLPSGTCEAHPPRAEATDPSQSVIVRWIRAAVRVTARQVTDHADVRLKRANRDEWWPEHAYVLLRLIARGYGRLGLDDSHMLVQQLEEGLRALHSKRV